MTLETAQSFSPQADDDFLFGDGLPCLRREGKLYYFGDMQPRVLQACRHFEVSFDQLAEKLGMTRPAMVLILKGYDPVSPALKGMIDRLLDQAGLLLPADCAQPSAAAGEAPPVVTTILSVPVPDSPAPQAADEVIADEVIADDVITVAAETVSIPQPLVPGRPAAAVPPVPPVVFAPGLPEFTPGLRRSPRRRRARLGS